MDIEHLREFVVFSQYMNFSTAAKELFLSQPALSSHIKGLEKDLGVCLVDRDASRLTQSGCVLVNEASELLQSYDSVLAKVKAVPDSGEAELVVAVDATGTDAATNWSIFIQRFLTEYPGFRWRRVACKHSSVSHILEDETIDCVIAYDCPIDEDVKSGILFARLPNYTEGRLCLWMSETHPLASVQELHWADMNGIKHPFAASIYRLWATSMKEALRVHGVEYTSRLLSGDGSDFLTALRDDEVQLYDTGYMRGTPIAYIPGWVGKPIADDDAESFAFVAYRKDHVGPVLGGLLEYLDSCQAYMVCETLD